MNYLGYQVEVLPAEGRGEGWVGYVEGARVSFSFSPNMARIKAERHVDEMIAKHSQTVQPIRTT